MDKVNCPVCDCIVCINAAGELATHQAWGEICSASGFPFPGHVLVTDASSNQILVGYYKGTIVTSVPVGGYEPLDYKVLEASRTAQFINLLVSRSI